MAPSFLGSLLQWLGLGIRIGAGRGRSMNLIQRWKQTALHNKGLVFSAFLVAAGTALYAFAAMWQVYILKESGRQATIQTEKLILAANRLAQAADAANIQNVRAMEQNLAQARTALDAQIESSRLDQRAWVGIKSILSAPLEVDKPIQIGVEITNVGKTPAFEFRPVLSWRIGNRVDINTYAVSKERRDLITAAGEPPVVLFPSQVFSTTIVPGKPNEDFIKQLESGTRMIYVFGELKYVDSFHRPHTTRFCSYYAASSGHFNLCDRYNYAN